MNETAFTLEVRRNDIRRQRIAEELLPNQLAPGKVLLAVDRFALTANNITYTQVGDMLGYWRFFPTHDDAWGRVPAMAYASVEKCNHPDIEVGERVWGFFPMGTHLIIEAGKINPFGFTDVSAHREGLAPIYSHFQRAATNPWYEAEREEQDSLLRGLFLTSWLCEDALTDADFYGAEDCLITSASSKTSIALAFAVKERGKQRSIGLTSPANKEFCEGLGCYDQVLAYSSLGDLDATRPAVLVDMAGNAGLNAQIHRHYGDQLRFDQRIGVTHRDTPPADDTDLPGPKPQMFFAPHQAEKRSGEWGAEGLEKRIGSSFVEFRRFADSWLNIRRFDGREETLRAFKAVMDGSALPSEGYTVSLLEPSA